MLNDMNDCPLLFENIKDIPSLNPENPADTFPLFCETSDISIISSKLENFHIHVFSQSLRLDVEKAKRQKLSFKLKRVRRDLIPKNKTIESLRDTIDQFQFSTGTLRNIYEEELACLQTVSYRSS